MLECFDVPDVSATRALLRKYSGAHVWAREALDNMDRIDPYIAEVGNSCRVVSVTIYCTN